MGAKMTTTLLFLLQQKKRGAISRILLPPYPIPSSPQPGLLSRSLQPSKKSNASLRGGNKKILVQQANVEFTALLYLLI